MSGMKPSTILIDGLRIDRSAEQRPTAARRPALFIIGAAVLAAPLVAWHLLANPAIAVEIAAVPAGAEVAGAQTGSAVLDASGYVVARRMATVSARITGRVREVLIEEGQRVEAGEVLAVLDSVDADAQRDLALAQAGAAASRIESIEAQLMEANASAARLETLVQSQLVSVSQFEQAIAQRDALRAELATSRRNADVAREQLRIADIGVDDTIVRAPFAGVVVAKSAQPGEIVSPLSAGGGFTRTGIGTLVDMDSLEVEVDVGEAYIGRVFPGMAVETALNAYPDWKVLGSVIAIVPAADRGKATVKVRISLSTRDDRVVPDMGATVSFLQEARVQRSASSSIRLPVSALVVRDGSHAVFLLDGDAAMLRKVEIGGLKSGHVEILRGLSPGEQVVLNAPPALRDGSRIKRIS